MTAERTISAQWAGAISETRALADRALAWSPIPTHQRVDLERLRDEILPLKLVLRQDAPPAASEG